MTCRNINIGVEESAPFGVVITGLQVIEFSFYIVDITAVAQGVVLAQVVGTAAGDRQDVAPGIVGVFYTGIACRVYDGNDIPLQVGYIVIFVAVVCKAQGLAAAVDNAMEIDAVGVSILL